MRRTIGPSLWQGESNQDNRVNLSWVSNHGLRISSVHVWIGVSAWQHFPWAWLVETVLLWTTKAERKILLGHHRLARVWPVWTRRGREREVNIAWNCANNSFKRNPREFHAEWLHIFILTCWFQIRSCFSFSFVTSQVLALAFRQWHNPRLLWIIRVIDDEAMTAPSQRLPLYVFYYCFSARKTSMNAWQRMAVVQRTRCVQIHTALGDASVKKAFSVMVFPADVSTSTFLLSFLGINFPEISVRR